MSALKINITTPENMAYDLRAGDMLIGNVNLPYVFAVGPQNQSQTPRCRKETIEETNLRQGIVIKTYLDARPEHKPLLQRAYNNARRVLTKRNEGLVKSELARYMNRGVETEDLFQEGRLALFVSTADWDYTKGTLSTHAGYHIRGAGTLAFYRLKKRHVNVPRYIYDQRQSVRNAEQDLRRTLGFSPSDKEIGEKVLLKIKEKERPLKPFQVQGVRDLDREIQGLSTNNSNQNELALNANTPLEKMLSDEELLALQDILSNGKLDPREKSVLRMQFGLDGNNPLNNVQIGNALGLTREMIRLISKEAQRKIRFYMGLKNFT